MTDLDLAVIEDSRRTHWLKMDGSCKIWDYGFGPGAVS